MRDYSVTWLNQPQPIWVSDLPTGVIVDMIDYTMSGKPIDYEGEDPEGVLDRLRLELEIRAQGLR